MSSKAVDNARANAVAPIKKQKKSDSDAVAPLESQGRCRFSEQWMRKESPIGAPAATGSTATTNGARPLEDVWSSVSPAGHLQLQKSEWIRCCKKLAQKNIASAASGAAAAEQTQLTVSQAAEVPAPASAKDDVSDGKDDGSENSEASSPPSSLPSWLLRVSEPDPSVGTTPSERGLEDDDEAQVEGGEAEQESQAREKPKDDAE
jgi:hypothetical protein